MPEKLQFNDEQVEYFIKIAKYYKIAKELIIYGEQIDPYSSTLAQTLSERTSALDHIMRVILVKIGMRDEIGEDLEEYSKRNLEKAYGHIYRAAYDALDWVALTIQERIAKDIENISLVTISAIMPTYFTTIRPGLHKIIHNDVTRLRNQKDVANNNESNLEQYTTTVLELKKLFDQVATKLPELIKYEKKHKRSIWIDRGWQAGIALLVGIIGWLIGHFVK